MRHWLWTILLAAALTPSLAGAEGIYLGSGFGLGIPTHKIEPLGKELDQNPGLAWEALSLGYDNKNWGVGVQWGGAGGQTYSDFFGDGTWSVQYLTLSARYIIIPDGPVNPYLEIGSGAYVYSMVNNLAAGAKFNLGRIYIATELDYHAADFSDATIDTNYAHSGLNLNSRVDMLFLMVKTGMQARD